MIKKIAFAMLVLPIVANASVITLVNKTRNDISYTISGVCVPHVIHNDAKGSIAQEALQVLCGKNADDCLLSVFQSKNCNKQLIFSFRADVNKGIKDAILLSDHAYMLGIYYPTNEVTIVKGK